MTDYNYTRPRRPVAAEISGPGPGYSLPGLVGWSNHDPRSIYSRAPAYHIGLRYNPPPDEGGPGPGLYNSNTKLYRTGKENPPAYTICGKRKEETRDLSPGPTDYACHLIHHVASKHFRPPAYSFGSSFRTWTPDQTPAPNQYILPSCDSPKESQMKRSPAYSIIGRSSVGSFNEEFNRSPGPGSYRLTDVNSYKTKSPAFTIASKKWMSASTDDTSSITPGPGSHETQRVWIHKRESPRFTFGIRHSPYVAPLILHDYD